MSCQFYVPAALPPGNKPRYPMNMTLDGPRICPDRFSKRENLLPVMGFDPRTVQPVALESTAIQNQDKCEVLEKTGQQLGRNSWCVTEEWR